MTINRHSGLAAAAALLVAFTAPRAGANDTASPGAAANETGRDAREQRIERTALRLCGRASLKDAGSMREMKRRKACIAKVKSDAMQRSIR